MEEGVSRIFKKIPDIVISLLWAFIMTGACYLIIYFAKFIHTLPPSFDLPWILLFFALFFIILMRKRVRIIRSEQKPQLLENK